MLAGCNLYDNSKEIYQENENNKFELTGDRGYSDECYSLFILG